MLFIEIEGANPQYSLEFHPRLTVVSDLSNAMRGQLVDTFQSMLFGDFANNLMAVDVGGVPQELTPELLKQLGLVGHKVSNVIRVSDLPGVRVIQPSRERVAEREFVGANAGASAGGSRFKDDAAPEQPAPQGPTPLELALEQLEAAEADVNKLMRRLEQVKQSRTSGPPPEMEKVANALEKANAKVAKLEAELKEVELERQKLQQNAGESGEEHKTVRLIRLRQIESAIGERIFQLREKMAPTPVDKSEVTECMTAALQADPQDDMLARRAELEQLERRYEQHRVEVERLESLPRPPEWLVNQTHEQIAEAQARITAFTYQIREGIDVRPQLAKAQEQLREAQEAWEELEDGVEGQLRAEKKRLEDAENAIVKFLGLEPGNDVREALTTALDEVASYQDPRMLLVDALARHGVDAKPEYAVSIAERWIHFQDKQDEAYVRMQQELAEALFDQDEARKQIAEVEAEPDENDLQELVEFAQSLQAELSKAQKVQQAAEAKLQELSRNYQTGYLDEEVAALESQYEEAWNVAEAAARKVEYFESLESLRGELNDTEVDSSDTQNSENQPWWETKTGAVSDNQAAIESDEVRPQVDLSELDEDALENFVLTHAASLRQVAKGETVPLILDAAFDDFPPVLMTRMMAVLMRIAPLVQVIYLTSNKKAENWVRAQDEMLAAKVTVRYR